MPFDLFISYSRRDNAAGRVTEFVRRIAADYRTFAGEELQYFFDTKEIQGAEDWRHRILAGLKQSKLFLLILSPNYLKSDYCQWEIIEYLKYEAARAVQGQGVTPIHFVEIPGLDGPEFQREANDWLMQVRRRNDWDLRPWFDEGGEALKRADVRARLEDLEDSLRVRLSRLRRMASAPGNLPAHNPHFVGRETEMLRLHEAAGLGRCSILTSVHGIGGLGKTALAIQYAYAYADFYPGGRWLISCANRDSLAGALRSLDSDLGVDFTDEEKRDDTRAAKRILRELEERSHRGAAARAQEKRPPQPQALVILDNVDLPHLLQPPQTDLISGRPWLHVLAATRMGPEQFGHDPDRHLLLPIDELPPENALRLIESHQPRGRFANDAERAAAVDIVKWLGGHALVVEVVAVHLAERAGTLTCAAMLERLKRQGLGEPESLAKGTNRAVGHVAKLLSVTLTPTLQGLTEPERLVLTMAALLPSDQVAIPWLRVVAAEQYPELGGDAPAGWDDPWLSLVNHLARMRLLQVVELAGDSLTPRVCRMHRAVQAVVAQRTGCNRTEVWSNLIGHAKSRCEFLRNEWPDWVNHWELNPLAALAHLALDRSADEGAWLANEVGMRLLDLARYSEAEPLFRRAMEARERVLGPDHPDTLSSVNSLALLLDGKRDYAGAEPLYRRAMEARERVLGPEHPDTLSSVNSLALLLDGKDDYAGAEPLLRRAMEASERVLGPDHPDTLARANNLAQWLKRKGDREGPMLLFRMEGVACAPPEQPDTTSGQAPSGPPKVLDENVQFTAFRPCAVQPQKWYPLLAFAHLSERPADAPPDAPDPVQEVRQQARQILGEQAAAYQPLTQDSRQAVPREGELSFIPQVPGFEFNPPQRSFRWTESVHREEFRMRASATLDGRTARGGLSVYLGSILLAEVPLAIRVDSRQGVDARPVPPESASARPYRKIFASYSHRDAAVVDQFQQFAKAMGDQYLRDCIDLRAGEVWSDRLAEMIREADVFHLFWSTSSMRSRFVKQEWEHALSLNRKDFIRPTYWEEPLPESPAEGLPPEELRRLHFQRIAGLLDAPRPALLRTLEGHSRRVDSVGVTPDGRRAVSASADKTLRVWDPRSGACLRTLEGHSDGVHSLSVTPDGRRAVSASGDATLRVWDLQSGACLQTLEKHRWQVLSSGVTPGGRRQAVEVEGHRGGVRSVSVMPDGRQAVSAGDDRTLRVWDLQSGACLALFLSAPVVSVAVSPCNLLIVCGTNTGEVLFLEPRGVAAGPVVLTLSRFLDRPGDTGIRHATRCLCCGIEFESAPEIVSAIESLFSHLAPGQSPCLDLPDAAFADPHLLSACPHCAQALKFNPFFVDMGQ